MLEKHGSKLYLESEEGKGSGFWFEVWNDVMMWWCDDVMMWWCDDEVINLPRWRGQGVDSDEMMRGWLIEAVSSIIINRKERKGFSQRAQRFDFQVVFSLRPLRKTFASFAVKEFLDSSNTVVICDEHLKVF